jgi:hypothetical protein
MAGRLNTARLTDRARQEVWSSLLDLMPLQREIVRSPHVRETERYLAAARLAWLNAITEQLNATDSEIEVDPQFIDELRDTYKPKRKARQLISLVKSA